MIYVVPLVLNIFFRALTFLTPSVKNVFGDIVARGGEQGAGASRVDSRAMAFNSEN